MTLPEVAIAVVVMGLIAAVMSTALTVTFRTQAGTEGRVNVARFEQNIDLYMPHDLASAADVSTDPAALPCGTSCPAGLNLSGSNAIQLSWVIADPTPVTTNVSYHFAESSEPGVYEVNRIECNNAGGGWECQQARVLSDLPGPPGGGLFIPGDTIPRWVLEISKPLAPEAVDEDEFATGTQLKDANRVVVTINGGGSTDGAGGGMNRVSITAGGTTRGTIAPNEANGAPTFVDTRSRCGGPIALIVDDSGSIGSWMDEVEEGVETFVKTFAGTPTQLQIVRFDTTASVVGAGSDWSRYFDMSDPLEVDELKAALPSLTADGGTNWEDAWFRAIYKPNGDLQQVIPETVIFFTDGRPTYERLRYKSSPGEIVPDNPPAPSPGWPTTGGGYYSNGSDFSQIAFNRTDWIVDQVRSSVRVIGVGVGGITSDTSMWIEDPGAGFHYEYERGFRQHQRATVAFEKSDYVYERLVNYWWYSYWTSISKASYDANNTTNDSSDGYRRRSGGWVTIGQTEYEANNTTSDESDGYRHRVAGWSWISTESYLQLLDSTDPYVMVRDNGKEYVTTDSAATDWEPTNGTRTDGGYRNVKVMTPPYDYYDDPVEFPVSNKTILSLLVSDTEHAVEGTWDGTRYTNADVAEMYVLPDIDRFAKALEAVALGECGGTVSVSTRVNGGPRATQPITFQNSAVTDDSGTPLDIEPTIVPTSPSFPVGTFDFAIPDGGYVNAEISPFNLSDMNGYTYAGWSCQSGDQPISATLIDMPDNPGWQAARVSVSANEAVSCILEVNQ